jgi:hypothetical protein
MLLKIVFKSWNSVKMYYGTPNYQGNIESFHEVRLLGFSPIPQAVVRWAFELATGCVGNSVTSWA